MSRKNPFKSSAAHEGIAGVAPAELPEHGTDAYGMLYDEVYFLESTAQLQALAPDAVDRLRRVLAFRQSIETEDNWPPAADLIAALDTFYALPEAVRLKLLNGWRMERWPQLHELAGDTTRRPLLIIRAGRRAPNGAADAHHELPLDDDPSPVTLRVRFGTRQHEVVSAIWDLWHLVETQWATMTAADPLDAWHAPLPLAMGKMKTVELIDRLEDTVRAIPAAAPAATPDDGQDDEADPPLAPARPGMHVQFMTDDGGRYGEIIDADRLACRVLTNDRAEYGKDEEEFTLAWDEVWVRAELDPAARGTPVASESC